LGTREQIRQKREREQGRGLPAPGNGSRPLATERRSHNTTQKRRRKKEITPELDWIAWEKPPKNTRPQEIFTLTGTPQSATRNLS